MQKACFIVLEGVDGAGKSTHFNWVKEKLTAHGIDLIHTREPGGTELGEDLRSLLLHKPMELKTETLLMFAARNEHWVNVIKPALDQNKWVLCDRFTDSTFAYQGGGRQLGKGPVQALADWLDIKAEPDCTFLFDLPLDVARSRLSSGRDNADRFEQENLQFFERTRNAYLERLQLQPKRYALINAQKTIEEIQLDMTNKLNQLLCSFSDLQELKAI